MESLKLDGLRLTVRADGKEILHDVSLSVLPGEFVAVMGPSGCGKSTLLHALNGYRRASSGNVHLNGTDLHKSYDQFRSHIGYVPQDDIIHDCLTVQQVLNYSALLRLPQETEQSKIDAIIASVVDQLGLSHRRKVRVRRLSGGQRKRGTIGVELLTCPPLLFLDEPTSGLDPGLEEDMMILFRKLADEGRTVLVTTHITESLEFPDLVALILDGRLVYYGPPAEALGYFRAKDYVEIFKRLRTQTPDAWLARFRQSDFNKRYVRDRLRMKAAPVVTRSANVPRQEAEPKPREEVKPSPGATPAAEPPKEAAADSIEDELARLKRKVAEGQ